MPSTSEEKAIAAKTRSTTRRRASTTRRRTSSTRTTTKNTRTTTATITTKARATTSTTRTTKRRRRRTRTRRRRTATAAAATAISNVHVWGFSSFVCCPQLYASRKQKASFDVQNKERACKRRMTELINFLNAFHVPTEEQKKNNFAYSFSICMLFSPVK